MTCTLWILPGTFRRRDPERLCRPRLWPCGMVGVGSRWIVRLGLAALLVTPSDGFIAPGVCVTRACRASCRGPAALALAAPAGSRMSEAHSAESMGNGWAGSSFGRTLGAIALALMLIVSPGPGALPAFADPAVADPVPAVAPAAVADAVAAAEPAAIAEPVPAAAPVCKEFASSCRAATGEVDPKAAAKAERRAAAAAAKQEGGKARTASRRYINLTGFPFPLGPFTERRTVETELVPGKVHG